MVFCSVPIFLENMSDALTVCPIFAFHFGIKNGVTVEMYRIEMERKTQCVKCVQVNLHQWNNGVVTYQLA